jgi:hypothetical protein
LTPLSVVGILAPLKFLPMLFWWETTPVTEFTKQSITGQDEPVIVSEGDLCAGERLR